MALRLLERLEHGRLTVVLPDGQRASFGSGEPAATIVIDNWSVFAAAARNGDIGFAEGYIRSHWRCDSLTRLLTVLARNREAISSVVYGAWWGRLFARLRHVLNRNSRSGSRRNINAHNDIGNAFYRLWLDSGMTYSSALYANDPSLSLADAQDAKYRRVLGQIGAEGGAGHEPRLLEIGCGWGGFAETAARSGAHVTGITLSTEQLEWARERLARGGLSSRADLELRDYRDQHGQYDGIASIEMFEAVGEAYWPEFFDCIRRNLKPGGRACVQTITIDDTLFDRYRTSTDFIQQYIFPGGMLPSPGAFRREAARAGLEVVDEFAFGSDYERTLRAWRESFLAQLPAVRAQRFDESFVRTWEFYLAYCEAAFAVGDTDVRHFTLTHA